MRCFKKETRIAWQVGHLPGVSGVMSPGVTAWYLIRKSHPSHEAFLVKGLSQAMCSYKTLFGFSILTFSDLTKNGFIGKLKMSFTCVPAQDILVNIPGSFLNKRPR